MTLAAIDPIIVYQGSGATTPLAVPFRFFANADLKVTQTITGAKSVLVLGADYTVTGVGDAAGGEVTPLAVIAVGTSWKIERLTARTQQTDFVDGNNFPSEAHENALDRLMAIDQEQDAETADVKSRAMLVPVGEVSADLPPATERQSKFLVFDVNGNPSVSEGSGTDTGLRTDLAATGGAALVGTADSSDVETALANGLAARPQMQQIIQKLRRGEDCAMSFAGDSTADATTEWVYLVAAAIAADYPAHTVEYRAWDDGASNYGAITTIQTGTAGGSAPTLQVYNASISGAVSSRFAGNQLDAAFRPAVIGGDPDLVVFSFGHNGLYDQVTQFASLAGMAGEATRAMPFTPMVIVGQNPVVGDETMAAKVEVFRALAAIQRLGWLDVHQSFKEYDGTLTDLYLAADTVHPSPLGSALWAAVFMAAFKFDLNGIAGTGLSNFNHGVLLAQQSYDDLSGWTATGLTVSEELTIFETATASAKLVGDGATSSAFLSKVVIPSDSIKAYRNRHISLTVRVYVGNGLGGNAGRVALYDGIDTTTSPNGGPQGDGFFNATVTHFVNNGATGLTAFVYINNVAATSETIYVDRITVADGPVPRDAGTRIVNSNPLIQSKGSFSPTLFAAGVDFGAVTYHAIRAAKWMRTGDIVHYQIVMRTDSITLGSAAGQVSIGGLPVAAVGGLNGYAVASITFASGFAGDVPISGMISPTGTSIGLYYRTAVNAADTALAPADLALTAAANTMIISGSYQVA